MAKRLETSKEQNFIPKISISQHAQQIVDQIAQLEGTLPNYANDPNAQKFVQDRISELKRSLQNLVIRGEADIRYDDLGQLSPLMRNIGVDPQTMAIPRDERMQEESDQPVAIFGDEFQYDADTKRFLSMLVRDTVKRLNKNGIVDTEEILDALLENNYIEKTMENFGADEDPEMYKKIRFDLRQRIDAAKRNLGIQEEDEDERRDVAQYAEEVLPEAVERRQQQEMLHEYKQMEQEQEPRAPMREQTSGPGESGAWAEFRPVQQKPDESDDDYKNRAAEIYRRKIKSIQSQMREQQAGGKMWRPVLEGDYDRNVDALKQYQRALSDIKPDFGTESETEVERKPIELGESKYEKLTSEDISEIYNLVEQYKKYFARYSELAETLKEKPPKTAPEILKPDTDLLDVNFNNLEQFGTIRDKQKIQRGFSYERNRLSPSMNYMETRVQEKKEKTLTPEEKKQQSEYRKVVRTRIEELVELTASERGNYQDPETIVEKAKSDKNLMNFVQKLIAKDSKEAEKYIQRQVNYVLNSKKMKDFFQSIKSVRDKDVAEEKQLQEDLTSDKPAVEIESESQEEVDNEITKNIQETAQDNKLLDLRKVPRSLVRSMSGMLDSDAALQTLLENPSLEGISADDQNPILGFLSQDPEFKDLGSQAKTDFVKAIQDGEMIEQAAKMLREDPIVRGIIRQQGKMIRNQIIDLFPYTTDKNEASYIQWMENGTIAFLINQIQNDTVSTYRARREQLGEDLPVRSENPEENEYILLKRFLFASIKRARQAMNRMTAQAQRENATDFTDMMTASDFQMSEILENQFEGIAPEPQEYAGESADDQPFGEEPLSETDTVNKVLYPNLSDAEQRLAKFFFGWGGIPKSLSLVGAGIEVPALPTARTDDGYFDWSARGGQARLKDWKRVEAVYKKLHDLHPDLYPKALTAEALAFMFDRLNNKMMRILDKTVKTPAPAQEAPASEAPDIDETSDIDETPSEPSVKPDSPAKRPSPAKKVKIDRSKIKTTTRIAQIRRLSHVRQLA
jgi:hypothetical protein